MVEAPFGHHKKVSDPAGLVRCDDVDTQVGDVVADERSSGDALQVRAGSGKKPLDRVASVRLGSVATVQDPVLGEQSEQLLEAPAVGEVGIRGDEFADRLASDKFGGVHFQTVTCGCRPAATIDTATDLKAGVAERPSLVRGTRTFASG